MGQFNKKHSARCIAKNFFERLFLNSLSCPIFLLKIVQPLNCKEYKYMYISDMISGCIVCSCAFLSTKKS